MRALYAAPTRAWVHCERGYIREPLDLLKGHPKEHQHSAWSGTECPGEGLNIFLRAG